MQAAELQSNLRCYFVFSMNAWVILDVDLGLLYIDLELVIIILKT